MNVVVLAVPGKFTIEVATKPLPFTITVNAGLPTMELLGASDEIAGTGLFTAKFAAVAAHPHVDTA
jgi:hypothetical protein